MFDVITANLIFIAAGIPCILLVMAGLPGVWLLLALAVGIELADVHWALPDTVSIGWGFIGLGTFFAAGGEAFELISGSIGAKTAGASRRGIVGALLGGLAGTVIGTIFIPIPVLGTLTGVMTGTFAGAWLGEMSNHKATDAKTALRPALAATLGRALGIVAKTGVATIVWVLLSIGAIRPMLP